MSNDQSQTQSKAPRTFQILDSARLVAILAIVWLHTPESRELQWSVDIGRFAVPFFTLASIFLAFQLALRRPELSSNQYTRSRLRRLYLLFLVWSAFYGVVRLASAFLLNGPRPQMSLLDLLWNGTAHHLWFLPFICLASLLGFVAGRLAPGLGRAYWPVAGASLGLCLLTTLHHEPNSFRSFGYTMELSRDVLPSVFLAITISMVHSRTAATFFDRTPVVLLSLAVWIGSLLLLMVFGRTILLETLSGLGLMIASLNRRHFPLLAPVAAGGSFALGLYLLHVLFMDGFQDLQRKMGWHAHWQWDLITFVVTLFCCTVTLFVLSRLPRLRWLLA